MSAERDTLSKVIAILERNASPTDKSFEAGGRLICRLNWLGSNAWLHKVMAPCPEAGLAAIAPVAQRQPPPELVAFLREANGLSLFNGSLKLHGVRSDFSRNPETAILLPFDAGSECLMSSYLFGADDFLVGTVGPENDLCVRRAANGVIDRIRKSDAAVLETWPSLEDWLVDEASRYSALHEQDGRLKANIASPPSKAAPWPQVIMPTKAKRWSPAWWHDMEERLGISFGSLPFGWMSRAYLALLSRVFDALNRQK